LPRIVIDSDEDPRLDPYKNIRHRDPAYDPNNACLFIAEGRLLVERLLASRFPCESILLHGETNEDLLESAEKTNPGTQILLADLNTIQNVLGYEFHRGILACGCRQPFPLFSQLSPEWFDHSADSPMLFICGVNNPENIGALMRTAAAFGVSRIGITRDVANPFSRRALRVSMGAALKLEIIQLADPAKAIAELSALHGFRTLATTLSKDALELASVSRQLAEKPQKFTLIMGSEGEGLGKEVLKASTDRVVLPMRLGTDSLNVNVAAAIFLYELTGKSDKRGIKGHVGK
jgi:tRNA G18 (ribose-2'-O)-methylase SpoU